MPTLKDFKAGYNSRGKSVFSVVNAVYPLRLLTDGEIGKLGEEYASFFDDFSENEPEPHSFWGVFGDFRMVGHGQVTNSKCGHWLGVEACLNVKNHGDGSVCLDGSASHKGEIYARLVHRHCFNFNCPLCYKFGASYRMGSQMAQRLEAVGKVRAGVCKSSVVEHISLSCPPKDYGLSFEGFKKNMVKACHARGIFDFYAVFHGFRYHNHEEFLASGTANQENWFWSPHWHILGFIEGGYQRCRSCPYGVSYGTKEYNRVGSPACRGCSGFEGVTRDANDSDCYIAKVEPERITVKGTASYQLNHATIVNNGKKASPVVGFGLLGRRGVKVEFVREKHVCPVCKIDLVRVHYFGIRKFVLDESSKDFKRSFWSPMNEGMGDVWVIKGDNDFG
jgi:hypothetical protein